jgi:hypothetical protein
MAYGKPFEEKPNSGSFHSQAVKKSENSPDYTGSITLDLRALGIGEGVHKVRLSGWKKISKSTGKQYMSLAVSAFLEQGAPKPMPMQEKEDDIPF